MERRSLTDRQKAALTALAADGGELHPSRVARLCGDTRPSWRAGAGWRNTLFALEGLGLVRASYLRTHGHTALFEITEQGREVLRG